MLCRTLVPGGRRPPERQNLKRARQSVRSGDPGRTAIRPVDNHLVRAEICRCCAVGWIPGARRRPEPQNPKWAKPFPGSESWPSQRLGDNRFVRGGDCRCCAVGW
ncbi:hypothetical protein JCM33774_05750 [Actinophytocola sp. KF-1]